VKGQRLRRRRERDRESGATVVEFVVLTPILFLLMFGSVQIGLALFARHVAVSAAQEGARKAREEAANPNANWQTDADNATTSWVDQLLGNLLQGSPLPEPQEPVPLTAPYPEVGMKVTFNVVSVVPFWTFTVESTSVGPVECFYAVDGRCNGD
jgi:Flp pilus assembly protein TadG